jgi:hypothetical protein
MAINALRLDGIWSITEGIAALAYDIKELLWQLGCQEAATTASSSGMTSNRSWFGRLLYLDHVKNIDDIFLLSLS